MRDVSAGGTYSRNLSFAQGIKGIGSTGSSWLVGAISGVAILAFLKEMGWRGPFPIFFVLMALAFVLVAMLKIEETKSDAPPSIGSSLGLLQEPVFALAVLGIFLYVGAEVCMGRFLLPGLQEMGMEKESAAKYGAPMFFLLLTIGRLVGTAVLTVMSPRAFFRLSALLGLVGGVVLMTGSKSLAVAGVVAAGFGFANIWPMLFSITVEEKPERASELSGLMCMAISGGALVPLVMGKLVDNGMKSMSFIVPVVCFAYLLLLSLKGGKKTTPA
jgi:fucose permease